MGVYHQASLSFRAVAPRHALLENERETMLSDEGSRFNVCPYIEWDATNLLQSLKGPAKTYDEHDLHDFYRAGAYIEEIKGASCDAGYEKALDLFAIGERLRAIQNLFVRAGYPEVTVEVVLACTQY